MAIEEKYKLRNFITGDNLEDSGADGDGRRVLSDALLSPNVVRIQVLDGNKVLRYLGGLERLGYENVRTPLMQDLFTNPDEKIFYGILKSGVEQSWELTGNWQNPQGGGGLLGMIKGLVSKVPVVGPGLEVVEGAVKFGERVTGTNTTATGSSTMKQYMGASLKSPSVTVSWYLPEQYGMCIRGLQTLTRMAYARDIGNEDAFKKSLGESAAKIANMAVNAVKDFGTQAASIIPGVGGDTSDGTSPNAEATTIGNGIGSLLSTGIGAVFTVNELFGKNLTFDPIPVRLCVGQYVDIEPLVITSLKITFSKEQYLSGAEVKGVPLHLPLFCTADITFEFWVNPSPSMQFMKFLGVEMFGPQTGDNTISNLVTTELNNKQKGLA